MDLDTITVNIRPRNPWEAIDIGFILARRYYWKLWLLWLLSASPALLLLLGVGLLLPGSTAKWALLLFWFFKPLYEPSLLFLISRALFGTDNSIGETITNSWRKLSFKRLRTILLYRLSPFRSFSLPVLLLEELEGDASRKRRTLLKDGYETSVILTLVGFALEAALTLSLMSILYWLIPEELRWVDLGDFIFLPDAWLLLFSYILSCSIFAPFYTCSGFMMYISRRVELEAWDIEIGFKRVQQRLEKRKNGIVRAASVLFLLCAISLSWPSKKGWSKPQDPEAAEETITTVLQQKEFGEKVTKYRWVPKEKDTPEIHSSWEDFFRKLFDTFGEFWEKISPQLAKYSKFLLWCCAGIIITFFLLRYSHLRQWLDRTFKTNGNNYTPPEIMFGMDLRPESLPEDIAGVSFKLLTQGKKREAMSLLYRGTLSGLVNGHNLEIHSSFTENECCDEVRKSRPESEATFFDTLTSLWVFIAYGHREPDTGACHSLVEQWITLYGAQS